MHMRKRLCVCNGGTRLRLPAEDFHLLGNPMCRRRNPLFSHRCRYLFPGLAAAAAAFSQARNGFAPVSHPFLAQQDRETGIRSPSAFLRFNGEQEVVAQDLEGNKKILRTIWRGSRGFARAWRWRGDSRRWWHSFK
jgi:hypothetical protein